MEALRYMEFTNEDTWVITSSNAFVNIPNYPELDKVIAELDKLPHVQKMAIEDIAKENKMPRGANMILLGMAAPYLEIISPEQLREAIKTIFTRKGDAVVESNIKAFNIGYEYSNR